MDKFSTLFVGLDVHKASIDFAVADAPPSDPFRAEIRHVCSIRGDIASLEKALRKLVSRGQPLHFVYEAGPCGFVIWRHLTAQGLHCEVVAPSSISRTPDDRVKTDLRDAMLKAKLARSGDLSVVGAPDGVDESIRDLVRARADAVREQRNGRHCLMVLLSRTPARPRGRRPTCAGWPRSSSPTRPSRSPSGSTCIRSPSPMPASLGWSTLRDALPDWGLTLVVQALQDILGVQPIAAMTLVAESQI